MVLLKELDSKSKKNKQIPCGKIRFKGTLLPAQLTICISTRFGFFDGSSNSLTPNF